VGHLPFDVLVMSIDLDSSFLNIRECVRRVVVKSGRFSLTNQQSGTAFDVSIGIVGIR
jgi:hypothetical protein